MAARTSRKSKPMQPQYPPRKPHRTQDEEFFCDRRDLSLQMHQCLTDYVNANALQVRTSPCHKCERGLGNRVDFAKGRI